VQTADLIDICELLGRSQYRIPTAMRLTDDSRGYCSSLAILFGDPNVDVRSGGLVGYAQIGERFGRKQRQTERILRGPHGQGVVRWFGDIPATNVGTADQILRLHERGVSETRRQARLGSGRQSPCPVSGGSTGLTNQLVTCVVSPDEPQPAMLRVSGAK
jgi:hypothetical protein